MEQMARIDARVPLSVKEAIEFASDLEGRIIAENQVVRLSLRDQKILADACADKDTREPDTYLENLAARYRDTVKSE